MWKTMMLTIAASSGLLACAGCTWLQALYATGSLGGTVFLGDFVCSLLGL